MTKECPACGRAFEPACRPVAATSGRELCADCHDAVLALREEVSRPKPDRSNVFIDRRDDVER
jgi:hypothetical protein